MKMHPRILPLLTVAGLGLATLTLNTGCFAVVAAGAGAGAVAYVRGELESSLDANFDRSLRAAQRTIEQLQFAKVSEKKDALVAVLVARNADDKRIEIRVESQGTSRSAVKIRVGIIGDESLSLTILEKIKSNL
jgi:hypothetical protein